MSVFWSHIIGHQQVVEQLERILERGSVPHAILFSGPEAVGKKTAAKALAGALLTANGSDPAADEKLRLLEAGNHPDFRICSREDEKKDISVEAIRDLCTAIRLKPYYATASVTIIDNAHEMNLAASNALLMSLEEPSSESYLILVTHAPQRLPATILSRCQQVSFGELSLPEIRSILERKLGTEAGVADKLISEAAQFCTGSLEALELNAFIEPLSLKVKDSKALGAHLDELLQRAKRLRKDIDGFIGRCISGEVDAASAVSLASQLASEADDSPLVWKILHRSLREALRQARRSDVSQLANLLELSLTAEKLVRERNVNPQLQLTSLLLEELR